MLRRPAASPSRRFAPQDEGGWASRSTRHEGGRGLAIYALVYLAFLYVPVLLLPLFSFNDSAFIAFPLSGFTTKWYAAMAADEVLRNGKGSKMAQFSMEWP